MNPNLRRQKIIAEINITPFTDVILVLLIIFMIATPFIYQSSAKVQLPQASTSSEETSRDIIVSINAQGEVFLENTMVDLATLRSRLSAAIRNKPNAFVVINGDKNVRYDSIIQVMDVLARSGVKNTALGIELKK